MNKQYALLTILFMVNCTTAKIPEKDFTSYRKGTFTQNEYNNSGLAHWKKMTFIFSRTDTSETVITKSNLLPEDTSYYRINWTTISTYEKTYLSGNNKWTDSLLQNNIFPRTRKYSIIKGTKRYYIQMRDKEKDTIWLQR